MHLPAPVRNAFARLDEPSHDTAVRNYLTLRKAIGILGTALPWVLILGVRYLVHEVQPPTISHYYYTKMGHVFAGILWSIGVFLLFYKGTRKWENRITNIAGLAALVVATLPAAPQERATPAQCVIGQVHIGAATVFFASITVLVLLIFTNLVNRLRTEDVLVAARELRWTEWIYLACGAVMFAALLWMFVTRHVSFWGETIAVEAFGVAWWVKGIGMFKHPADLPLPDGTPPHRLA